MTRTQVAKDKVCKGCGSIFSTPNINKKFCTKSCYYKQKKRKLRQDGRCVLCWRYRTGGQKCECQIGKKRIFSPESIIKIRKNDVAKRAILKREVLSHYGDCICACCGESNIEFLQIDHINNDGAAHRKSLGSSRLCGHKFYRWLKRNGFPTGFQVLCSNCNMAKGFYGECPHERLRREARELAGVGSRTDLDPEIK
jgi:hypothetical protein